MSPISVFSFTGSAIILYLGIKTFIKDPKNKLNLLFSLFCLSIFLTTISFGISYLQNAREIIAFTMKFASLGIFTFIPFLFHFCLLLSRTIIKVWIVSAFYSVSAVLIIIDFMGTSLFSDYIIYKDTWVGIINVLVYSIYLSSVVVFLVVNTIVLYKWGKNTTSNKEKLYSGFLLAGTLMTFISCQAVSFIFPLFNIYDYQFIGIIIFFLYIMGLYYLISQLRFLNISYSILADEILSNINDLVLILDQDLRITTANKNFEKLFLQGRKKQFNGFFHDFIADPQIVSNKTRELAAGDIDKFVLRINYKNGNDLLITDSYVSAIKDKFNDINGFLVISSEIKGIKNFQKHFKITNRELQIIEAIISGLTYREISERFGVSEKTVESHLAHIYNKLCVKNRIQLAKIAGEFNIKPYAEG